MDTTNLTKELILTAPASDIYKTLTNSTEHSELTGEEAKVSREKGGKFSAFDGWVTGEVIELKQDEKFSFTWTPDEEGWPKDHISTVVFELFEEGDNTKVVFTHNDLPENIHEDFEKGWEEYYFKPLVEKFGEA
jgi:activator of HSP90 ATPase